MSGKAIVKITDVIPGTELVPVEALVKGDIVFDGHGGEHTLARDARRLASGQVSIKRTDYHTEYFEPGAEFARRVRDQAPAAPHEAASEPQGTRAP